MRPTPSDAMPPIAAVVCTAVLLLLTLGLGPAAAATPFSLFESGHVRPLALSPDGTQLFAVNTPDNRLEVFDVAVGGLTHVVSVPVGLDPVAVAARTNDEVWVVNHLSDSVSIVDVSDPATARVVRTLLVGDEPRDIVFAGASFDRAFITTAHRGQNTPFHATVVSEQITPGTGLADVWVFDATSLGASLGGDELTIVNLFGHTPRPLAVNAAGSLVYAGVFQSGNQTTIVAEGLVPDGGEGAGGLPEPNTSYDLTPQPETGLIVQFDGVSQWLDELGRDWSSSVKLSLPDEDVFVIDANGAPPDQVAGPSGVFASVGTVLFNMIVNPASGKVYVTNTEGLNRVRFEGPGIYAGGFKPGGEPASVRGHTHEARITVLDGLTVNPRHLNKHIDYSSCCAPIPNAENDTSIGFPLGMAIDGLGDTLYVAGFGSSEIGVYDTTELENDTFVPDPNDQIPVSGGGPTGMVLDETRSQLYVMTRFDNAVKVLSTGTGAELDAESLHNPEPADIVVGRPFLYDTSFSSSHGDSACASCHAFGDFDGLAWDLGDPDIDTKINPGPFEFDIGDRNFRAMKGPMTVQSLRGMANHGAMHWRGDRSAGNDVDPPGGTQPDEGAFDENQSFLNFNVAFPGLVGRDTELPAEDMQKFTDFILQVMYPPNPIRNLDNSLTASQLSGFNFFMGPVSDSARSCVGCHKLDRNANAAFGVDKPGFFGTDGTWSFQAVPQMFKTPHLRNLYQKVGMHGLAASPFFNPGDNGHKGDQVRGFGFMHDGSSDTIFRFHSGVVFNQGVVNPGGIPIGAPGDPLRRDLEAFTLAFDTNLFPIVGQQITRTSTNGATVDPRITLMLNRADAGECDVVVKGRFGGEDQGWTYIGGGQFGTDRDAELPIADAALRVLANVAGQELTYTAVPPGEGERHGVDQDGDGFLDGDERDGGTDPADAFSVPDVCPGDPGCVKCQRVIEKEGWKFARAKAKHLARCEGFKIKGKLPIATDCATETKTVARIDKARDLLAIRIANTCGGDNKTCDADATEDHPAVLGWSATCPNIAGGDCANPISDCSDIATCLECIHDTAVDRDLDLVTGMLNLSEPVIVNDLNKCQAALAKESRKFLDKKSKAIQKCWDKRLKGNHSDTCPDPLALLGSVAQKTAAAIAKAEASFVSKVCKRCGGDDRGCDDDITFTNGTVVLGTSGADDLTPAAIGFTGTCPDLTIPHGGIGCAGPVTTLAKLVECSACVLEYDVDCMDRSQVPEFFDPHPAECNP